MQRTLFPVSGDQIVMEWVEQSINLWKQQSIGLSAQPCTKRGQVKPSVCSDKVKYKINEPPNAAYSSKGSPNILFYLCSAKTSMGDVETFVF